MDALGYRMCALKGGCVLRESEHQVILVRPQPLRWALVHPWPHIATAASLDPWRLAAAIDAAKETPSG